MKGVLKLRISREDYRLYLVTDRSWQKNAPLLQQVEEALKNGVTMVQMREKDLDTAKFCILAQEMRELTSRYQIPLIINDNLQVALEVQADGLHLGQGDMPCAEARQKIGPDMLLGLSVHNLEQALKAQSQGADYLGVGAVFPTISKDDASHIPHHLLKEICSAVEIPVVAIGGIYQDNLEKLKGSGIAGIAVISAILASEDIPLATRRLLEKLAKVVE